MSKPNQNTEASPFLSEDPYSQPRPAPVLLPAVPETGLILDTETNGQEGELLEVIELACVAVESWLIPSTQDKRHAGVFRYKPTHPILPAAMATHHIIPEVLEGYPPSSSAAIPRGYSYVIGHNIDYDAQALRLPPEIRRICTLAISRAVWPDLQSHALSALLYAKLPAREARSLCTLAHGAEADVELVIALLKVLSQEQPEAFSSLEALWRFSEEARVPLRMPWGKHKGELISALPRDYVRWLRGNCDLDQYLLEALRRAGA